MLAIFVFGLMIFVHEFGHFITARIFKVKVNEFAIGMGPALLKKQGKETLYSLRLLPIGGFCAMEGEDEDSDAEDAFGNQPAWQRCIILSAGAIMNFITGVIILLLIFMPVESYVAPIISNFSEGFSWEGEEMLLPGDEITKINGYNIFVYNDISVFLGHGSGEPYDFTVLRDGKKLEVKDLPLVAREYKTEVMTENGVEVKNVLRYGIEFTNVKATFFSKIDLAFSHAIDFIRLIKVSIFDIFSGKADITELSGPVGITSALTKTAKTAMSGMWLLVALIAINLGAMNLLPLPALDGGRIFFLVIEVIRGKPINPKYEGFIHFVGIVLLFSLMIYVSFNDIVRIINS